MRVLRAQRWLVSPKDALAALFHDVPKAVLGNVQTALKPLLPDHWVAFRGYCRPAAAAEPPRRPVGPGQSRHVTLRSTTHQGRWIDHSWVTM